MIHTEAAAGTVLAGQRAARGVRWAAYEVASSDSGTPRAASTGVDA